MKLLVDMNLSPEWVGVLEREGYAAVHWSTVSDPKAKDAVIMTWAKENGYVVFTHDLDFGTILAVTRASGPSVLQVRTQDTLPENLSRTVLAALAQFADQLEAGALVTVDEGSARVRILPIQP